MSFFPFFFFDVNSEQKTIHFFKHLYRVCMDFAPLLSFRWTTKATVTTPKQNKAEQTKTTNKEKNNSSSLPPRKTSKLGVRSQVTQLKGEERVCKTLPGEKGKLEGPSSSGRSCSPPDGT